MLKKFHKFLLDCVRLLAFGLMTTFDWHWNQTFKLCYVQNVIPFMCSLDRQTRWFFSFHLTTKKYKRRAANHKSTPSLILTQSVTPGGKCYKAFVKMSRRDRKTWLEAREYCKNFGTSSDLVSIHSQGQLSLITTTILPTWVPSAIWLGLNDLNEEGKYVHLLTPASDPGAKRVRFGAVDPEFNSR